MAMAAAPSAPGHYTTTIVPANPSVQQNQLVHHTQLQPQIHQSMALQPNPTYQQAVSLMPIHNQQQQQQQQQQQPQQVVQTRIVHVSHRQAADEQPTKPNRQFVTFKNLRHLNAPGGQWEHCEHITISLSPDELERKVRCHDIPGNDLTHCLTSMGLYRQRHVKRYEEKLNQRETDPSNWTWVLEALGELRDKPKATPHTFWAVFSRTSRKTGTTQAPQVRLQPQVTVHHEPAQIIQAAPEPQQLVQQPQQHIITQALPQPQTQPPQLALPAPPVLQTRQLALPAPPTAQPVQTAYTVPTYSTPTAYIQPAQSGIGSTTSGQLYSQQPQQQYPQQPQQQPIQTAQAPAGHAHQQYQDPRTLHVQYQQSQVQRTTSSQALVALPAASSMPRPTLVRQLTSEGSTSSRDYSRPIPRPYSPPRRSSPLSNFRSSEIDVHQYQVRDQSPVRSSSSRMRERERWFDDENMSDDSTSSYGSRSSSGTSFTEYSFSKSKAPLGNHNSKSSSTSRKRRSHDSTRHRSNNHGHPTQQVVRAPVVPAPPPPRMVEEKHYTISTAPVRPTVQRQNTYDVEVRFGTTTSRPAAPVRRTTDSSSTPRSYGRNRHDDDDDYESEEEDRYGKAHRSSHQSSHGHHGHHQQQMPGAFNGNGYSAAGLVSYGGRSSGARDKRY